jgi:hypothetical protein
MATKSLRDLAEYLRDVQARLDPVVHDLTSNVLQFAQESVSENATHRPGPRRGVGVSVGPQSDDRGESLWDSIRARALIGSDGVYSGLIATSKIYSRILELGGTIEAKNKPYLVFQGSDGGWVSKKKVTIPKYPYFKPGFVETVEETKVFAASAFKELMAQ